VTFHPSAGVADLYRVRADQLPSLYARDKRWLLKHPNSER
jgi:hypothetical protein